MPDIPSFLHVHMMRTIASNSLSTAQVSHFKYLILVY